MARKRFATLEDLGLSPAEFAVLRRLDSPQKIQSYLHALKQNFEVAGETCDTVRTVLRTRRAHCIEGAMLAACAFWVHGEPPLLLDMRAERDFDHVVALYRRNGCWGALSKTNGVALRSRDPVYRTLRELAMSYFHEYCNRRSDKTLREYSVPFDLRRMDPALWVSGVEGAWRVAEALDELRHFPLLNGRQLATVTRRDPFERRAAALSQYRTPLALVVRERQAKAKRQIAARKRKAAKRKG
ncbi:MAG TPA: hypothetical protein VM489_17900 [Burkholderiales bacterium]|nr:hypothetical protein [Burkholderiales bacterium]